MGGTGGLSPGWLAGCAPDACRGRTTPNRGRAGREQRGTDLNDAYEADELAGADEEAEAGKEPAGERREGEDADGGRGADRRDAGDEGDRLGRQSTGCVCQAVRKESVWGEGKGGEPKRGGRGGKGRTSCSSRMK